MAWLWCQRVEISFLDTTLHLRKIYKHRSPVPSLRVPFENTTQVNLTINPLSNLIHKIRLITHPILLRVGESFHPFRISNESHPAQRVTIHPTKRITIIIQHQEARREHLLSILVYRSGTSLIESDIIELILQNPITLLL